MRKLMLGNEAVARGAYEAGCRVSSAYPGTPSTEISEYIARYDEIFAEWAPNEKVAMEVAVGASIAGARAICCMKHVGLNVAADPLFTASYTGVNAGLVVMVADDPGMHSSQNEQDSRYYARSSKVPMLEPADSEECRSFVRKAFELSEKFDCPVIVRLTTRIAHSQSIVEIQEPEKAELKEYKKDFKKYVMMPSTARVRHVEVEKRMSALKEYAEDCEFNKIEWNGKKIGVITSGVDYQYTKEAIKDASILKLGMVYPLPEKLIRDFAAQVEQLYVIEQLEPFIEQYVKSLGIKVVGKEIFPVMGEYSSSLIRQKILGEKSIKMEPLAADIPVRPPVMCPGCPHRGVYHVLKKLKLVVSGDIGCYTLGALPPTESMDTCVCMGASVSMAHGMNKARGDDFAKKTVAVIGDSTFVHSGITGLIDIVYNKGISTVLILDNRTTGMTGHQHNPATGFTLKGEPTKEIDFIKLCEAIGVERVVEADPFDIKTFEKVLKEELSCDEPSVIVAKRPCALLKGVKYEGPRRIDSDKCKNCKACMLIGCPAIIDSDGRIEINEALCVGCMLCTKVCNFGAISKAGVINE